MTKISKYGWTGFTALALVLTFASPCTLKADSVYICVKNMTKDGYHVDVKSNGQNYTTGAGNCSNPVAKPQALSPPTPATNQENCSLVTIDGNCTNANVTIWAWLQGQDNQAVFSENLRDGQTLKCMLTGTYKKYKCTFY